MDLEYAVLLEVWLLFGISTMVEGTISHDLCTAGGLLGLLGYIPGDVLSASIHRFECSIWLMRQ